MSSGQAFIYHLLLHCTIIYCCTVIYWCTIIFCCTTIYDCPIIALSSNIVSSSTIAPLSVTAPSFPLLQHITTAPPSIPAPPSTIVPSSSTAPSSPLLHHLLPFTTLIKMKLNDCYFVDNCNTTTWLACTQTLPHYPSCRYSNIHHDPSGIICMM